MKRVITLTEQDIRAMVMETIEEINARRPNRFAQWAGITPSFDRNNDRHMRVYDTINDWFHFTVNKLGLSLDDGSKLLCNKDYAIWHIDRDNKAPKIRAFNNGFNRIKTQCQNDYKIRPEMVNKIAYSLGEDIWDEVVD